MSVLGRFSDEAQCLTRVSAKAYMVTVLTFKSSVIGNRYQDVRTYGEGSTVRREFIRAFRQITENRYQNRSGPGRASIVLSPRAVLMLYYGLQRT